MIDLAAVSVADLEHDPFPVWSHMRRTRPVGYLPAIKCFVVTRAADIQAAAADPERFPARVVDSPIDGALGGVTVLSTDGQHQKTLRRPLDSTLRPRSVEAALPAVVESLCDQYLAMLYDRHTAELMAEYFEPISVLSLAHAIGIADLADAETLRRWFVGLAAGVGNYEADPAKTRLCEEASAAVDDALTPRIAALLRQPDSSMLSNLVHAAPGSFDARLAWLMPTVKLMLIGGLQEPGHGAGTVAWCLLADDDALCRVRAEPDRLLPTAIEEGMRWTPPIGNLLRGVGRGARLGGVELPEGSRVILCVGSGNRDEAVWGPDADRFSLLREPRPSFAFGSGPHYCVGHHFARVQVRIALRRLLDAYPRLRLDPESETRFRGFEYRAPSRLDVLLR